MGLAVKVTAAPAAADEPLTLEEAKRHLRILHADDDATITELISECREQLERDTRRTFAETAFEAHLDEFPETSCGDQTLRLPRAPVTAVASVSYYDADGVLTVFAPAAYVVDLVSEPARIAPIAGTSWPTTQERSGAVVVAFTAGHTPTDCPRAARSALKLLLGSRYALREAEIVGTIVSALPSSTAYDSLIESLKVR